MNLRWSHMPFCVFVFCHDESRYIRASRCSQPVLSDHKNNAYVGVSDKWLLIVA